MSRPEDASAPPAPPSNPASEAAAEVPEPATTPPAEPAPAPPSPPPPPPALGPPVAPADPGRARALEPPTARLPRAWLVALGVTAVASALASAVALWREASEPDEPRERRPPHLVVPDAGDAGDAGGDATPDAGEPDAALDAETPAPPPGPWRVSALEGDAAVEVVRGTLERRGLLDALAAAGVPRAQGFRLLKAFARVRKFDKPHKKDAFVVALDRPSRRLRAFEYVVGPTEIWQAREGDDGLLVAARLDLHVEEKRVALALPIVEGLDAALQAAGVDGDLATLLDEALAGRARASSAHPGASLRVLAREETALGVFARWSGVDAVELRPPGDGASPLRVYRFTGKHARGWFDARGHQPYQGGWRSPIPGGRVSSRFNPHRMHPVLHVVMPHNGVDFGASTGTPVYAASYGSVETVGESGPSGNLVTLAHPGGIVTGYAHLSRFAPGLHPGQKVEARQLVGYVGTTGRSTGPHLHFGAKRNGVFFDPLTLRLDGERVLPKGDRSAFEEARRALDAALDAIALPAATPAAPAPTATAPSVEPDAEAPDAEDIDGGDIDLEPLGEEAPH